MLRRATYPPPICEPPLAMLGQVLPEFSDLKRQLHSASSLSHRMMTSSGRQGRGSCTRIPNLLEDPPEAFRRLLVNAGTRWLEADLIALSRGREQSGSCVSQMLVIKTR